MIRTLLAGLLLLVLAGGILLSAESLPEGTYRKPATEKVIQGWLADHAGKKALMPAPPPVPPLTEERPPSVDFSGTYRFGIYDYDLTIEQEGDTVVFRSGGVDRQDIGGAFETIGMGQVRAGRIHARWWCLDLSRNYANNGGAELWFHDPEKRERLYVRYYHDADEKIEEGYGVRLGSHEGETQHYRIRIPHPVREYPDGLWLRGRVRGRDGEAIENAVVMLRHENATAVRSDGEGRFELRVKSLPTVQMISAAAPGYHNGVEAILKQEVRELEFRLEPSPYSDDPRYEFVSSRPERGREIFHCGNCHKNSYAEWSVSRHAYAASNPVTRAVYERDFLPALAAGKAKGDPGLCAACHAPQASLDGRTARLNEVTGVALEGNHCDFCHKVHHTARIEEAGVRGSLALGRPNPFDKSVPGPIKRVYGTLGDSDYLLMGPTFNPYFGTSALCAGCHQYTTNEGIPALTTYAEWSEWAVDRPDHESCQHCHMPTGTSMEGSKLARRICVNALRRPEEQIHDHSFLGRPLAPLAAAVAVEASLTGGRLRVRTTVASRGVGHRMPTGSADKHLLLVVLAVDDAGRAAPLSEGPRVPDHAGGEGDPLALAAGDLARRMNAHDFSGMPGREFAQVLVDAEGKSHVPFWRAERLLEDTRLRPGEPVTVEHLFEIGEVKPRRVRVELWHRLRFKRHDVAADVEIVEGNGVRPLDLLLVQELKELER